MARKNALTRVGTWQDKAKKARATLSKYRREQKSSAVPEAFMNMFCTLGGAAGAGVIHSYMDEIMGIPGPVVFGLLSMGIGAGIGGQTGKGLICASGGMLASYVTDTVESSLTQAQIAGGNAQALAG